MNQENCCGFACGNDRFAQVVLISQQVKAVPISLVCGRPGLAGSLLIFAEDQDNDISLLRDLHGCGDAFGVECRIAEHNFVGIPVGGGFGNFAAFGVEHLGRRSNFVSYTLQNADTASGIVAVSAEMEFSRVRADDRNPLVLRFSIQGQQIVLILQQDDCLMSGFQCQLLMFGIVGDLLRIFGIDGRIVEQASQEFQTENACNRSINITLRNFPLANLINQAVIGIAEG